MKITDSKWVFLICVIASCLLYHLTFNYGQNLDDFLIYDQIPYGKEFLEGTKEIFNSKFNKTDYRPVLVLSYFLETFLYPTPDYTFSHKISVLLYGILCFSIYLLLVKLPFIKDKKIALVITLLFLFHPVHTNVVCNLKSRDNILSMLLTIWSLLFWAKAIYDKKYYYGLVALFFSALGIFAKLDAVYVLIIPVVLLGFNKAKWRYSIVGGIFLLAINLIIITNLNENQRAKVLTEEDFKNNIEFYNENPLMTDTTLSKWSAGGVSFLYYLKFNIIPTDYFFYFGYNTIDIQNPYNILNFIGYTLLLILLFFSIYSFFIKKTIYGFGVQWFLISIAFFLNIYLPVAGIVADRHTFIASLGYCMVLGAGIFEFSSYKKFSYVYLLLPILVVYTYFDYQRSRDWKDILTLIKADMPHLKRSYDANRIAAQNYLAEANATNDEYTKQQYLDKVEYYALQGLQVYDKEYILNNLLGKTYFFQGETDKSFAYLNKGLANYANVEGYTYIGEILHMNKDYHNAARSYVKGYVMSPHAFDLEYKTVDAYCKAKMYSAADSINTIISKNPSTPYVSIENKGYITIYQGDTAKAYDFLSQAMEMGLSDEKLALKIADYKRRHPNP